MKNIVDVLKILPAPIVINLATLTTPAEISQICKANGIKQCAYTFTHRLSTVMKHGESAPRCWDNNDSKDPNWGERMYRQAANIPGWNVKPPRSPSGADMRWTCDEHFPNIHKDEVSLTIYNMTGYTFTNPKKKELDTKIVENILVQNTLSITGRLPDGNIQNTNSILTNYNIPDNETLHKNFTF